MELDIVVLGGTGYTGALVVEHLARGGHALVWAIAARSKHKMRDLQDRLLGKGLDISQVPMLTVDVNEQESLVRALSPARLVLNCVGPNTRYSAPVVTACLATNTHYVDMSAEINHILSMYVKFHKAAEAANVLVVPSSAFASLLAASGYIFLKDQFQGELNQVECYARVGIPLQSYIPCTGALASYGTWDSLVQVLLNFKQYQREKAKVFPAIEVPEEMKRDFYHLRWGSLWFPYPGPDQDVMEFSERYLQDKQKKNFTHFKLYTKMPLLIHYLIIPAMFLYFYLSYFTWFADLLRRYPRFFTLGYMSHEGPSERMRKKTTYSFTYIGKGWDKREDRLKPPTKKMQVKVSSNDPYGATAILMVAAAITILKEPSQMPRGGVVNVGAAFYDTKIVDRLKVSGFKYEILPP